MKRIVCSPTLILAILLMAALLVLPVSGVAPLNTTAPATTTAMMPGSDRDSHGCIGSAGYTWCEAKQKCLREWEESCTAMSPVPPATVPITITQAPLSPFVAITGITFACGLAVLIRKR
jgi:hypothetical protein